MKEYYNEINLNEFYDSCDDKTLAFSYDEINFINKEIYLDIPLKYIHTCISYKDIDDNRIYIYKLPDEWYVVEKDEWYSEERDSYYKCDQLEGLLKCINDL